MNTELLSLPLIWAYLTTSILAQVFLLSAIALLCGLGMEVWLKAVRFSHFNHINLHDVEFEHPHLPSVKVIATSLFCSVALLAVGLISLRTVLPFDGPYESIQLIAIFLVFGALGIVAELRWKGANQIFFAGIAGTSASFLLLVITVGIEEQTLFSSSLFPLGALIGCVLLNWRLLYTGWSLRVLQVMGVVCLAWLFLFLLS